MNFKDLHNQNNPLIIANVWDVPSAKVAEKLNFQAIATSSSAIASLLGYQDGEDMDFTELEYFVKRIITNTNLPLSVDLEAGYSREPIKIVNHIKRLAMLGVVGINLEDSLVVNGKRELLDIKEFAKTLKQITQYLKQDNLDVFINVRIDTFLLGFPNVIEETKDRVRLYEKSGIDGVFTPCIENESDIEEIVNCTTLPVNVMCMPNLPDFETLRKLGVRRVSMGNFLFGAMYNQLEQLTQGVLQNQSFRSVF